MMNEVERVLEDVIESLEVISNINPTNSPDLLMKNARRLASLLPLPSLLAEAATASVDAKRRAEFALVTDVIWKFRDVELKRVPNSEIYEFLIERAKGLA